ncbi:type II secretion system protein [Rubeoparvulum massiliense]|uniref:type II secretion system protein n=1 Tax=Rubeoparvulum massiliense TaxID=1631346 RepID=UPI00065DCA25|nr:type II secretion system protein [Rubeoparvulum massiliense]
MKRLMRNEKGLTLIELLAVIVILGIIAAIAVPNIGGIINKTKDDAVKAEAIQILEASKLFMATYPPLEGGETKTISKEELDPYLDNLSSDSFSVLVESDSATNKYKYKLIGHRLLEIKPYTNYETEGITLDEINNPKDDTVK